MALKQYRPTMHVLVQSPKMASYSRVDNFELASESGEESEGTNEEKLGSIQMVSMFAKFQPVFGYFFARYWVPRDVHPASGPSLWRRWNTSNGPN